MSKLDFTIPYALAFSVPAIIIFTVFMNFFIRKIPIFNLFIDSILILGLSVFWIIFIIWIKDRDISGNPLNHYQTLSRWRDWYY